MVVGTVVEMLLVENLDEVVVHQRIQIEAVEMRTVVVEMVVVETFVGYCFQ